VALAVVLFVPLTVRSSRLTMLYRFAGLEYDPAAPGRRDFR
jgi:hypothetical protein